MARYRWAKWVHKHLNVVGGSEPELICRCPFPENHKRGDIHPSFNINVEKGLYICHGCKAKGHITTLAKQMGLVATPEPPDLDRMVNEYKRTYGKFDRIAILDEQDLDQYKLGGIGRRYWRSRGLSNRIIREWNLGYDHVTHSVTIPIRDFHGRLLGVIKRQLSKRVKT